MSGFGRANAARTACLCAAAVTIAVLAAGCGSNGNAGFGREQDPRQITPKITGVVFAPNGQFAAAPWWPQWARGLELVPRAYAQAACTDPSIGPLCHVEPVGIGTAVSLSLLDAVSAKDGSQTGAPIAVNALTDAEGRYEIVTQAANNPDACRLMVAAGSGRDLTRAFVTTSVADIDPASEAVVRVVLKRVTQQSPPAQLCDFTSEELRKIYEIAVAAAYTADGDSLQLINNNAAEQVSQHPCVQNAVARGAGEPVGIPAECARFYP